MTLYSQTSRTNTETVVPLAVVREVRSAQLAEDLASARNALAQGDIDETIAQLEGLLDAHPRDAEVAELLGSAYLLALQTRDAVHVVSEALREHPAALSLRRLMYRVAVAARDAKLGEHTLLQIARLDATDGKCLEQLADLQRR